MVNENSQWLFRSDIREGGAIMKENVIALLVGMAIPVFGLWQLIGNQAWQEQWLLASLCPQRTHYINRSFTPCINKLTDDVSKTDCRNQTKIQKVPKERRCKDKIILCGSSPFTIS